MVGVQSFKMLRIRSTTSLLVGEKWTLLEHGGAKVWFI